MRASTDARLSGRPHGDAAIQESQGRPTFHWIASPGVAMTTPIHTQFDLWLPQSLRAAVFVARAQVRHDVAGAWIKLAEGFIAPLVEA